MKIPLRAKDGSIRAYALVDDEDFEWLSRWRWHLSGAGYVVRNRRGGSTLMSRQVLGLGDGDEREADHLHGVLLDNRRAELRVVTHAQNQQNVQRGYGASPHRGVAIDRRRGGVMWSAQVQINGRKHHLGRYRTEEEAAEVAAAYRKEHMPYATT